ncbi:pilus assembly FimT family protein [Desulfofundulus australicus]|nr:hypothetical protein [Desulfofundulus australicus]
MSCKSKLKFIPVNFSIRANKLISPVEAHQKWSAGTWRRGGFVLVELSISLLILMTLTLFLLNFHKIHAAWQLKIYTRQLVSDIRYIQQQSIMNLEGDLQYRIKFYSKYLDNANKYQIWRGNIEIVKEVKLPETLEMYYGGAEQPFNPDPDDPTVRVLAYKSSGEIATNTGTVNLRDKINERAVGVVVHRMRVRIGAPNEVAY